MGGRGGYGAAPSGGYGAPQGSGGRGYGGQGIGMGGYPAGGRGPPPPPQGPRSAYPVRICHAADGSSLRAALLVALL